LKNIAWLDDIHYIELEGERLFEVMDHDEVVRIIAKDNHNSEWILTVKDVISDEKVLFYSAAPLPLGIELMFISKDLNAFVMSHSISFTIRLTKIRIS